MCGLIVPTFLEPGSHGIACEATCRRPSFVATGSMLSSIRNRSSSVGRRRVIRSTTAARAASGCDQSARANGVDKRLDVLPVGVEVRRRDRSAMSDVKGRVGGQLPPETLEVGQPLVEEAVGEIGVLPVVHLVAEEHRLPLVAEEPDAVMRRLARPEVEHGKACTTELEPLSVGRGARWERALERPFIAEHGAQDLLLERIVAPDHRIDAGRGDDGHVSRRRPARRCRRSGPGARA